MASRRRSLAFLGLAFALVGVAPFSAVHAEPFATDVPDRVWVDFGGAVNEVATNAALSGSQGVGVTVNFEDVFNLPGSKTTARMLGTVRISEKRRYIDFGYVDINRSASRIIDQDINWGDYTFQAGAQVSARFATKFIYAAFRYDFLHEEKIRISGSAGLTYLDMVTSLSGQASYDDPNDPGPPVSDFFDSDQSTGAPVPLVGLNLDWALTRRLVVRTYSRFFRINFAGVDGGLYESGVRLNWYFVKNFGMGLGFDKTNLKLKELELSNHNKLRAAYDISGAGLYFNLAF